MNTEPFEIQTSKRPGIQIVGIKIVSNFVLLFRFEKLCGVIALRKKEMKEKYLTGDPLEEMIVRSNSAARKETAPFGGKSVSEKYNYNYSDEKNVESPPPVFAQSTKRSVNAHRMSSKSPQRSTKYREPVPHKLTTPTKQSSRSRTHKMSKNDHEKNLGAKTPEKYVEKRSPSIPRCGLSPNRKSFQSPQRKLATSPKINPTSASPSRISSRSRKLEKEIDKIDGQTTDQKTSDKLIHQNLVDNYLKFAELLRKKTTNSRTAEHPEPTVPFKTDSAEVCNTAGLLSKDGKIRKSKCSKNSSFKTVEQDNARAQSSKSKRSNADGIIRTQDELFKKFFNEEIKFHARLEDHLDKQQTSRNEAESQQEGENFDKLQSSSHHRSKINPLPENNFNVQANIRESESRQSTYASLSLGLEKDPVIQNNSPPAATSQRKAFVQEQLEKELRSRLEEYHQRSRDKQTSKSKSKSDQQSSNSVEKQLRHNEDQKSKSKSKSDDIPMQNIRSNLEHFQVRPSKEPKSMSKSKSDLLPMQDLNSKLEQFSKRPSNDQKLKSTFKNDDIPIQDLRSNLEQFQVRPNAELSSRSKSKSGHVPYQDLGPNEHFQVKPREEIGLNNNQPKTFIFPSQDLRSNSEQDFPNEKHRSRSDQIPSRDVSSIVERSQVRLRERELTSLSKSKREQVSTQNLRSPPGEMDPRPGVEQSRLELGTSHDLRSDPGKIDLRPGVEPSRLELGASQDLRSHLEEFQLRQKEDLKMLKQCNLDIVLPPEPTYQVRQSSSSKNSNNNVGKPHSEPSLDDQVFRRRVNY